MNLRLDAKRFFCIALLLPLGAFVACCTLSRPWFPQTGRMMDLAQWLESLVAVLLHAGAIQLSVSISVLLWLICRLRRSRDMQFLFVLAPTISFFVSCGVALLLYLSPALLGEDGGQVAAESVFLGLICLVVGSVYAFVMNGIYLGLRRGGFIAITAHSVSGSVRRFHR